MGGEREHEPRERDPHEVDPQQLEAVERAAHERSREAAKSEAEAAAKVGDRQICEERVSEVMQDYRRLEAALRRQGWGLVQASNPGASAP